MCYLNSSWPKDIPNELKPFYNRKDELIKDIPIKIWKIFENSI